MLQRYDIEKVMSSVSLIISGLHICFFMDYKKREILIANNLTIRILSKSGRRGSNPRPSAWKANALSTELLPQFFVGKDGFEPPKSKDSRFTVCPIWPLWYLPFCTLKSISILSLSSFVSQLRCKDTTIFVNSKRNRSFLLQ